MKLQNGSQVTERPARGEGSGVAGYFAESNDSGAPSHPGQDWFNDVIEEHENVLTEAGEAFNSSSTANMAKAISKMHRNKGLMEVSGTENDIILTSPSNKQPITSLDDMDEFSFIVSATNTSVVTIQIDDLDPVALMGVVSDTQIFATAILTVRYIDGSFYIAEQVNPKTGNPVALIGDLLTTTFSHTAACRMRFDAGELNRETHPILFAKAQKEGLIDQATKDADLITYGGKWGDGDGEITFTSPTPDGAFIRYSDNSRGLDVGREIGSYQADAIRNITGTANSDVVRFGNYGTDGAFGAESSVNRPRPVSTTSASTSGLNFDVSRVVPTADDNRPVNYAFNAEFLV